MLVHSQLEEMTRFALKGLTIKIRHQHLAHRMGKN
jgi:hypothetical protein